MEEGVFLAMLFADSPELSVDADRYLLIDKYAPKGQHHMLGPMILAL